MNYHDEQIRKEDIEKIKPLESVPFSSDTELENHDSSSMFFPEEITDEQNVPYELVELRNNIEEAIKNKNYSDLEENFFNQLYAFNKYITEMNPEYKEIFSGIVGDILSKVILSGNFGSISRDQYPLLFPFLYTVKNFGPWLENLARRAIKRPNILNDIGEILLYGGEEVISFSEDLEPNFIENLASAFMTWLNITKNTNGINRPVKDIIVFFNNLGRNDLANHIEEMERYSLSQKKLIKLGKVNDFFDEIFMDDRNKSFLGDRQKEDIEKEDIERMRPLKYVPFSKDKTGDYTENLTGVGRDDNDITLQNIQATEKEIGSFDVGHEEQQLNEIIGKINNTNIDQEQKEYLISEVLSQYIDDIIQEIDGELNLDTSLYEKNYFDIKKDVDKIYNIIFKYAPPSFVFGLKQKIINLFNKIIDTGRFSFGDMAEMGVFDVLFSFLDNKTGYLQETDSEGRKFYNFADMINYNIGSLSKLYESSQDENVKEINSDILYNYARSLHYAVDFGMSQFDINEGLNVIGKNLDKVLSTYIREIKGYITSILTRLIEKYGNEFNVNMFSNAFKYVHDFDVWLNSLHLRLIDQSIIEKIKKYGKENKNRKENRGFGDDAGWWDARAKESNIKKRLILSNKIDNIDNKCSDILEASLND